MLWFNRMSRRQSPLQYTALMLCKRIEYVGGIPTKIKQKPSLASRTFLFLFLSLAPSCCVHTSFCSITWKWSLGFLLPVQSIKKWKRWRMKWRKIRLHRGHLFLAVECFHYLLHLGTSCHGKTTNKRTTKFKNKKKQQHKNKVEKMIKQKKKK